MSQYGPYQFLIAHYSKVKHVPRLFEVQGWSIPYIAQQSTIPTIDVTSVSDLNINNTT